MTRKEERVAHAMSFEGKDIESEGLKEIVRLAIYEGSTWADKTMIEKACEWLKKELPITDLSSSNMLDITFKVFDEENKKVFIEDFRKAMEE